MDRYDIVNGHAAFEVLHYEGKGRIISKKPLRDMVEFSMYRYAKYNRSAVLGSLEIGALFVYFTLVERRLGREKAAELADQWARIGQKDGVTIHLENSDDDPTMISVHVQDPIAGEWADNDRSIEGSSWEECDGPDFVHTSFTWHPGILDELKAEGYDLDLSVYSEPDERDVAIAIHASECDECEYNWHAAEEHVQEIESSAPAGA